MPLGGGSLSVLGSTLFFCDMDGDGTMPGTPAQIKMTEEILSNHQWRKSIISLQLAPRLSAVIALVMLGDSDKQIATKLRISRHTVRTYLTRLYQRYGVTNRVTLVLHVAVISRNP
jgi:DNA-binding NarL/FixJ family response regulator